MPGRCTAFFVDRILRGTSPAAVPFERTPKFQFVLNLKTAEALGLEVTTATLLLADKIIE
jgi:putative tryptophan/tyrosine transport system substrate-binding protein